MTLQSGFCLCPDLGTDNKWSSVDLRNLFDLNGLSDLWNDLVRTGELVPNNDSEFLSKFWKNACFSHKRSKISLENFKNVSNFFQIKMWSPRPTTHRLQSIAKPKMPPFRKVIEDLVVESYDAPQMPPQQCLPLRSWTCGLGEINQLLNN